MALTITNIQRASLHDGPGIRTTVFLKGCSLRCFWCHNPETLDAGWGLRYAASRCIQCGTCTEACGNISAPNGPRSPLELVEYAKAHGECSQCRQCAALCPAQAMVPTSCVYGEEELLALLLADLPYYESSGGGVTFSGGEPLMQAEELLPVMRSLGEKGISVAVDTAGNVPWNAFQRVLEQTDLFLFDLKTANPELHRQVTGSSNRRILENLERLYREGASIRVRIPLIPGVNTSLEEQERMADILAGYPNLDGVDLLPFHRTALTKYRQLGMEYQAGEMEPPEAPLLRQIEVKMRQKLSVPVECR